MLVNDLDSSSAKDLCDVVNAPLGEVMEGCRVLATLGVNISKGADAMILAKEWK